MTTAECHHRLDSFDTGLIHDSPAVLRFNGIKCLNDFLDLAFGLRFLD
jgi:hypothetical protein